MAVGRRAWEFGWLPPSGNPFKYAYGAGSYFLEILGAGFSRRGGAEAQVFPIALIDSELDFAGVHSFCVGVIDGTRRLQSVEGENGVDVGLRTELQRGSIALER